MDRVLVLGARGMLGSQLAKLYPAAVCWDKDDVDVTDDACLRSRVRALDPQPEAVINCVAFNDVDGAEHKPAAAFLLNAEFPGRLARFTRELGIPLVHYSTNYVFDGENGAYAEDDKPAPLSVYGESKLEGERQVAANTDLYYIVRTAVIFGPKGSSAVSKRSFVEIMLDMAVKNREIKAVNDEINSVTFAPDLAAGTARLLAQPPACGAYHVTNVGAVSWYGFAREIFRIAGLDVNVVPVSSDHFPRSARRPPKADLLNTKLPAFRSWKEALTEYLGVHCLV